MKSSCRTAPSRAGGRQGGKRLPEPIPAHLNTLGLSRGGKAPLRASWAPRSDQEPDPSHLNTLAFKGEDEPTACPSGSTQSSWEQPPASTPPYFSSASSPLARKRTAPSRTPPPPTVIPLGETDNGGGDGGLMGLDQESPHACQFRAPRVLEGNLLEIPPQRPHQPLARPTTAPSGYGSDQSCWPPHRPPSATNPRFRGDTHYRRSVPGFPPQGFPPLPHGRILRLRGGPQHRGARPQKPLAQIYRHRASGGLIQQLPFGPDQGPPCHIRR